MNLGYDMIKKYNRLFSEELKISPSIRITTVKPSGTISSVVGVTRYYFFIISDHSDLFIVECLIHSSMHSDE